MTTGASPAADATSIADLKGLLIGAQTGTTSFTAIEEVIQPTQGAQAFNTNDDAKLALENGQVDAIVRRPADRVLHRGGRADRRRPRRPAADAGGQRPATSSGSCSRRTRPLTAEVTAAVDALRENGTLDDLATEWLGGEGQAPLLK